MQHTQQSHTGGFVGRLEVLLRVDHGEWRVLLLSFGYFFFLLAGYYVLRPIRDQFGVANGADNLHLLYSATFVTMLLMVPVFGKLSAAFARVPLIAGAYLFFSANLIVMYFLHRAGVNEIYLARVFFVWVSVYNLFIVSLFWSFMVDVYRPEQTTRLFGIIASGGSLGAICGGLFTGLVVTRIGSINLLPVAAALLLITLIFVFALVRLQADQTASTSASRDAAKPLGGGMLDGVKLMLGSHYLLSVAAVMLLYALANTFLNMEQAKIVEAGIIDADRRTQFFAAINVAVNILTLTIQLFITGRLVKRFGLGVVAVVMPLIMMCGLLALMMSPTLAVLLVVQTLSRGGHFSIMKPVQDMFFSIVSREAKYKTKNVVDTLIYRGGDSAASWLFSILAGLGLGLSALAAVGAALAALWTAASRYAGGRFDEAIRPDTVADGRSSD